MTGSLSTAALLTATAAGVVALVALGLAGAARRAGLAHPRTFAGSAAAAMVVWLAATAALARSGVLADWSAFPPRWPLLPLTALGTFVALSSTDTFRRLLAATPVWRPVALQTFRVAVELAFWRLHAEGVAPVQVTFEGRNFDALVGLSAPFVAAGIASGWIGPRATIAWNLFGLAMLANAIATVATSSPGPLHLAWPGEPFAAIAAWPVVWIPALLAPVGIFLHVVSIRQAFARLTSREPGRLATEGC
ncbi:hypothetical protein [Paludisphaera mucosa]|uniref:MFS transporter n=1 Tax=Paludisphaera mucosa TaxID=3030827 RepID=A0ABT6F402_9BACT|nr:hypothetical protein [Paludisphaera mucosa]MDG3002300.1 hypothetical protein [Paludisphaera mucosa]